VTLQTQEKKEEPPPPKQELASVVPRPRGFQTLSMPTNIPINIPPPSANTSFNAADFSGVGVEGGVARASRRARWCGPTSRNLESVVEERPELISHPPVHYPEILSRPALTATWWSRRSSTPRAMRERGSIKILSTTTSCSSSRRGKWWRRRCTGRARSPAAPCGFVSRCR